MSNGSWTLFNLFSDVLHRPQAAELSSQNFCLSATDGKRPKASNITL